MNTTRSQLSNSVEAGSFGSDLFSTLHISKAAGIVVIFFVLFTLIFNVFTLVSILHSSKLRANMANLLVCHLATLDLIFAFSVMLPLAIAALTRGSAKIEGTAGFFLHVTLASTVWTITALCWNKYQVIASPLRYTTRLSYVKIVAHALLIWCPTILFSLIPIMTGLPYRFYPDAEELLRSEADHTRHVIWWYFLCYNVLFMYVPCIVLCCCCVHLFRIASSQRRNINFYLVPVPAVAISLCGPTTGSSSQPRLQRQPRNDSLKRLVGSFRSRRKASCTIGVMLGSFVGCYLPFGTLSLVELISGPLVPLAAHLVVIMFLSTSPIVNATVYGIRNRVFRRSFAEFVRNAFKRATRICRRTLAESYVSGQDRVSTSV